MSETIIYLAECESGKNAEAINWNDHGSPSYGLLQFKQGTFDAYGEKYGLEHSDIMNPIQQIAIANKMLKEKDGWKHWYNCLKGRVNRLKSVNYV